LYWASIVVGLFAGIFMSQGLWLWLPI
jgi:hypothetical protein